MLCSWLLLVAAALPVSQAIVPVLRSLYPKRGYDIGRFRLTVEGTGFAFLPDQASIMVGEQPCTDVRIEKPWSRMSCIAPPCAGCSEQRVRVSIGGVVSNSLPLEYAGVCDGEQLIPSQPEYKLPRFYSGEENCTICTTLVLTAIAASPDRVSFDALRRAARDACGSPIIRSFASINPDCRRTRRDYFTAVRYCILPSVQ